jgi:hypothetical protein
MRPIGAAEISVITTQGSRAILSACCPVCAGDRNAEILAEDTLEEEDKASGVWASSTYSILRCLGCGKRYIRLVQSCSEDADLEDNPETGEPFWAVNERVTYWPSPTRQLGRWRSPPRWFGFLSDCPELSLGFASDYPDLARLLGELYTALDNNLDILATIRMRTVFDCASQKLGTDPNQNFAEKLKELTAGNKIGGEEKEMLSVLADAGSAAAHRGWRPTKDDIHHLMDALEAFLKRAFVLKHHIRRVKKAIPARGGY